MDGWIIIFPLRRFQKSVSTVTRHYYSRIETNIRIFTRGTEVFSAAVTAF